MSYKVETASNDINLFGESPLWDNRRQQLVFTDCFSKSISLFDPLSKTILKKKVVLPQNEEFIYTGVCMPYSSTINKFLITLSSGKLVEFDWELEKVTKTLYEYTASNFLSDGKCDSKGRYWLGTASVEDMGALKFEPNKGQANKVFKSGGIDALQSIPSNEGDFTLPNGLAFNKEQNILYWNDLMERVIKKFDFDLDTGTLSNAKVVFDFKDFDDKLKEGFPDGLALDLNGDLWVACWKGWCVIKIDAQTGKLVEKINLPVRNVTSVSFGGKKYNSLYVTTTSVELDLTKVVGDGADAGKIFEITNPLDNSFKGFQEHFVHL